MTASVDQLRALPWAKLIAESRTTSCDDLHSTLMKWFRLGTLPAEEAEIWHQVEPVLGLFIQLDVGADRPFHPSQLLDAISKELLANLALLAVELASDDLQARILDLGWLRKACDYKRVGECVAAYIKSAQARLQPPHWVHAYGRFKRAIEVGSSVGRNQAFLAAVAAIESLLDAEGAEDPLGLSHKLMQLLQHFDVGDPAKYAALSNASALVARGRYQGSGVGNGLECERERIFLDLETVWRRRLDDDESVRKLHLEVAEAFVRQAEGVIAAKWPQAKSVATRFIESAVDRLRQVGGQAARVDELRLRLQTLQREAVAEMKGIEFSVDVTEAAKDARTLVADKEPFEALRALAFSYAPPPLEDLHEEVRLSAKETPFKALIPQSYLGPRGTVLVEHAGIASQDDTTGFDFETMRTAHGRQSSMATVYFHIAAQQILLEHGLDTPAFGHLAQSSTFVPSGRERSFARGLAAGLRGDYELSTVILVPQFEHAVRELFVRRDIVTATLPSTGAQNEYNLNQLLEHPRAAEIFGAELVYDLRVLLTEKAGANLRNDIAHGLLEDYGKIGAKIYFWWTCLRFVLVPIVGALRATEDKEDPTKTEGAKPVDETDE